MKIGRKAIMQTIDYLNDLEQINVLINIKVFTIKFFSIIYLTFYPFYFN